MNKFNKILISLFLLPYFFTLFIAFSNRSDKSKITIWTWSTPIISIGSYIGFGSTIGFGLSSSIIFILNFNKKKFSQKVKTNLNEYTEDLELKQNKVINNPDYSNSEVPYIERDIREASPTISTSYRVKNSDPTYNINKESKKHYSRFHEDEDIQAEIPITNNRVKSDNLTLDDWQNNIYDDW